MLPGVLCWLVPHNLTNLYSLNCTHETLLYHWPLSYGCVYCDVFYGVYFHCMISFCCNYHGYWVLYPCYDIYVYVYLNCCDDFCGERRYNVSLWLSWMAVLIAPTNCPKFVWWMQAYLCCCYLTYCEVHMNVCDLVWDCDVVWDYFGKGENP